jgi:hypothetical protein
MGIAIFATGLLGWGTLQVATRANLEGMMWIAVWAGASLYVRRKYTGAGVAFGVACCLKPYPVLWLGLMARQGKFRGLVAGVISAVVATLGALLAIDRNPLRAYQKTTGESNFFTNYIVAFRPMDEMKGDHSLFQTMKTIARVVRYHGLNFPVKEYYAPQTNDPLAWKLYHAYLPMAALLGLLTLWMVCSKPVLNQVFALGCVTAVLPMVAGDYTLTVLLIPMGFFLIFLLQDVAEGKVGMSFGQMLWYLLPCAWVMGTEQLWVLHGVFKCVAILVLMGASMTIRLPSTLFGDTTG